jgi:hypothetical protein
MLKILAFGLLAAGLLVSSGCKKGEPPPPPGTMNLMGVKVDLPRLEQEFQNASPEQQAAVQEIKRECRTWQLAKMVVALDTLGKNPALTESQKKVVSDLIDQVGQVMAKQGTPAGH